jgi:hypothetical protein
MKRISHPADDYKFFLDICTETMTGSMEQFSIPFRSLAKECSINWQKAFMDHTESFSFPLINWPNPSDEKISQLQKEADFQLNRIEQLEIELEHKSTRIKEQVKQISNLKNELSSKKRESTRNKKK